MQKTNTHSFLLCTPGRLIRLWNHQYFALFGLRIYYSCHSGLRRTWKWNPILVPWWEACTVNMICLHILVSFTNIQPSIALLASFILILMLRHHFFFVTHFMYMALLLESGLITNSMIYGKNCQNPYLSSWISLSMSIWMSVKVYSRLTSQVLKEAMK